MPAVDVIASGTISTNAVKPAVMNGRFATSFSDAGHIEELIEPHVGEQVQRAVEEREQAEHPPEPDHVVPAGEPPQRASRPG